MRISKIFAVFATIFTVSNSYAVLQWDGLDEHEKKVYFTFKDAFCSAHSTMRSNTERLMEYTLGISYGQPIESLPNILRRWISESRGRLDQSFTNAPRLAVRREQIMQTFDQMMERYVNFVMPLLETTVPLMSFFTGATPTECTTDNYGTTGEYASTIIATGREREQLLAYNGFSKVLYELDQWNAVKRQHVLPIASDWSFAAFVLNDDDILLGRKIAPVNANWLQLMRLYGNASASAVDITSAKLGVMAHTPIAPYTYTPFKPALSIVHYNTKSVVASICGVDLLRLLSPFELPLEPLTLTAEHPIPAALPKKTSVPMFTIADSEALQTIHQEIEGVLSTKPTERTEFILAYGRHLSSDFMARFNTLIEKQFTIRGIKRTLIPAQKARDTARYRDVEGIEAAIINLHNWMNALADRGIVGATKPELAESFVTLKTFCTFDPRYHKFFDILLRLKEIDESYGEWPDSPEKTRIQSDFSRLLSAAMYQMVDHQKGHWHRDEGNTTTLGCTILMQTEILGFFKNSHPTVVE